jgi:membrane fusion protein
VPDDPVDQKTSRDLIACRRVTLFRQEAIEFQREQRQWGETPLLQPFSSKLLAWFIVLTFAAVLTFVCLAPYARKETVVGYLSPAAGTAKVFAPRAGVISAVYVKQGQWVKEGDNLLKLTSEARAANGEDVNAALLATLQSHKAELATQIAAEEARTNSERERLSATVRNLISEKADLDAQAATQGERIQLAESLVSSASQLTAKGYMSDLEFTRRKEGVLEQKQTLSTLRRQMASLQNQPSAAPLGPERICLQTVQLGAAKKYLERRLRRYVGPAVRIPFPPAGSPQTLGPSM